MSTCKFIISNDHIIVDCNGENFILDTGCPFTFRFDKSDRVNVSDKTQHVNMLGNILAMQTQKADADRLTGVSTDGILGMDFITSCECIAFDTKHSEMHFGADECIGIIESTRIPMKYNNMFSVQPYFTVDTTTEKGELKLLLDTGAFVNYVNVENIDKTNPSGIVEDFNPQIGVIKANAYEMNVSVGGVAQTLRVAESPAILTSELKMLGCDGILGFCQYFNKYPVIKLDMNQNCVILCK